MVYSEIKGLNNSLLGAVCFHDPVSMKNLTFFEDKHSFNPKVTEMGGTN
jgi:hypothetical protein